MKRIVLKPNRDFSVARHHPWIFSGAIAREESGIASGETVVVVSAENKTLGYGSYSPLSQIRVRMLAYGPAPQTEADIGRLIRERVVSAVRRRADLLAGGYTNAARLIHAENDGLPGVIADVYGRFVVCQFSSAGAERWKGIIAETLMASVPDCRGVGERTDLKDRIKEGLSAEIEAPGTKHQAPSFHFLAGEEPPDLLEIAEGPCKFLVDVRRGHKTGFYLDQRDARAAVGSFAKGKDVLNCFCYTGGFGLMAAANGARSVTQVDLSADALALARQNETLQPRILNPQPPSPTSRRMSFSICVPAAMRGERLTSSFSIRPNSPRSRRR